VTHHGLKTYRFILADNLLFNAENNPENAVYYQLGLNGFANLTSVALGPVFVSKSFYFQTDPRVVKTVNFTNWEVPNKDDY